MDSRGPALSRRSAARRQMKEFPAMAMDAGEIERLIKASIPDARVTIRDLAGDGDHYSATVVSASFKGKSRVQQHQLVYDALQGQMGGVLHALALQTAAPETA
jgi:stress-induced morphogen